MKSFSTNSARFLKRKTPHEKRILLDEIAKRIGITKVDDWYRFDVKRALIEGQDLQEIIEHSGSLVDALSAGYPEEKWLKWKFSADALPSNYWSNIKNQREFFDAISKELNFESLNDWYRIEHFRNDLQRLDAYRLKFFESNAVLLKTLTKVYPDHKWRFWKFGHFPSAWKNPSSHQFFFESLFTDLKLSQWEDWYKVTRSQIDEYGGNFLLKTFYNNNHIHALMSLYPLYDWNVTLFRDFPHGFWGDETQHRTFMLHFGKRLGIKEWEEWYNVQFQDFVDHDCQPILSHYGGSISALLQKAFPEYPWSQWKRSSRTPKNFWNNKANQLEFFESLRKELSIKCMDDWYKVTKNDVQNLGGAGLLNLYDGSFSRALESIYPEQKWESWKFAQTQRWFDADVKRAFFDDLFKKLKLTKWQDWYQISGETVRKYGGVSLLTIHGSLMKSLMAAYPELPWSSEQHKYTKNKMKNTLGSKSQLVLFKNVKMIFSDLSTDEEIFANFHYEYYDLEGDKESIKTTEFDVFVPKFNLAFEYQGEQHYDTDGTLLGDKERFFKDRQKKLICERNGLTLISVPFWWDQKIESLEATIHKYRPDVVSPPRNSVPIPEDNPFKNKLPR